MTNKEKYELVKIATKELKKAFKGIGAHSYGFCCGSDYDAHHDHINANDYVDAKLYVICLHALKQYLFDKNVYEHYVYGDYVDVDDVIALVEGFSDITIVPLLITTSGTVAFTYIDGFSYEECQFILNGSEITVYYTYEEVFELFEGCDIAYINHELLDSALENSNYQFTEVEQ